MSKDLALIKTDDEHRKLLLKKHKYKKRTTELEVLNEKSSLITFTLEDELYGIELGFLKEILKQKKVTFVPGGNPCYSGIINLRGTILTVINTRKLLGFNSEDLSSKSRIMIIEYKNRLLGLLVDSVTDIIEISKSQIHSALGNVIKGNQEFLAGLVETDNQIVILPDLKKIFSFNQG